MRYLLGVMISFVFLFTVFYFSLKIWHIDLIELQYVKDGWIVLLIVAGVSFILSILLPFFFKSHQSAFDKTQGRVAQPKK